MRNAILLLAVIAGAFAYTTGVDTYICEVVYPNFCAGGVDPCPQPPTITLDGTAFDLTDNFNVITFGDFNAPSSDVQGRLAVKGNFNVKGEYSVGFEVYSKGPKSTDAVLPYSTVVAGDLYWKSGEVHPTGIDGDGQPSYRESLFVGGSVLAGTANNIAQRKSNNGAQNVVAELTAAQAFYTALSAAFGAVPDNAQYKAEYGTLTITCNNFADQAYYVTIDGTKFSQTTSYDFKNCNKDTQMVFNIAGTGNVVFKGTEISPSVRRIEKTLFNILGSGRKVYVATSNGKNQIGGSVQGSILAPNHEYAATGGVVWGISILGNVATSWQFNRLQCLPHPKPVTPPKDLCPGFESDCTGLTQKIGSQSINFRDFNALSFGDFICNTGDVEGRIAVQGSVSFGAGYSIGYELSTAGNVPDRDVKFSLIAGKDVSWISGSIHPDGTGIPYPGNAAGMFVGGVFTGPDYLSASVLESCNGNAGCLDAAFNSARACYNGYSATASAKTVNVKTKIEWSGLWITCDDSSATEYVLNQTPEQMAQYTYTSLSNCNNQAAWVINIVGTTDVVFSGASFPAGAGSVVYNVAGTRSITVDGTTVNGHLLAPGSTLNQIGGLIIGKVVVAHVASCLQINKQNVCPTVTIINVPVVTVTDTNDSVFLRTAPGVSANLRVGDDLMIGGQKNSVVAINGDDVEIRSPVKQSQGLIGYAEVPSNSPRSQVANPSSSSATAVTAAFALVVVALAL